MKRRSFIASVFASAAAVPLVKAMGKPELPKFGPSAIEEQLNRMWEIVERISKVPEGLLSGGEFIVAPTQVEGKRRKYRNWELYETA